MLQDRHLYNDVIELLNEISPTSEKCFTVARRTMTLKSQVLSIDPWEENYGRILLYGHLHAHSLERACHFTLSHGLAVYWGILMDIKLTEGPNYFEILATLKKSNISALLLETLYSINKENIRAAYRMDTISVHIIEEDRFSIIKLAAIGDFEHSCPKIPDREISWGQIETAFHSILEDLSAQ